MPRLMDVEATKLKLFKISYRTCEELLSTTLGQPLSKTTVQLVSAFNDIPFSNYPCIIVKRDPGNNFTLRRFLLIT